MVIPQVARYDDDDDDDDEPSTHHHHHHRRCAPKKNAGRGNIFLWDPSRMRARVGVCSRRDASSAHA